MMPTAGSAVPKSPSHARVTPPSPTACSAWLTTPVDESTQLQAMPAATSGTICGRKSTVARAPPTRRDAIRLHHGRDDEAEQRPGSPLKKMISSNACSSTAESSWSVKTVL